MTEKLLKLNIKQHRVQIKICYSTINSNAFIAKLFGSLALELGKSFFICSSCCWCNCTPLGTPVVPDVNRIWHRASGETDWGSCGGASSPRCRVAQRLDRTPSPESGFGHLHHQKVACGRGGHRRGRRDDREESELQPGHAGARQPQAGPKHLGQAISLPEPDAATPKPRFFRAAEVA